MLSATATDYFRYFILQRVRIFIIFYQFVFGYIIALVIKHYQENVKLNMFFYIPDVPEEFLMYFPGYYRYSLIITGHSNNMVIHCILKMRSNGNLNANG